MNKKFLCHLLVALSLSSIASRDAAADDILIPSSQVNASDVIKLKALQMPAKPKLGLALGGGGARGAAEVGVMEVLEKEGLHFDYIAGTSIGSIVGGLYDAGLPMAKLREEFETGRAMHHFMTVPLPVDILLEPIALSLRLFGYHPYDGLYSGVIFKKYLNKLTPDDYQQIQQLKTPYAAVCLNLLDGKPYMIRGGSLVDAMRASSAVPGLRKPIPIGDKLFVDGGVACNLPVKQVREMGADIVLAVNIDEPFNDIARERFRRPGSVTKRMINWDLHSIDKPQEELADIVIHPDLSGISLITTKKKLARKGLEAGRAAAEAALPAIREKLRAFNAMTANPTTNGEVSQTNAPN